jgi:hypothetical protein
VRNRLLPLNDALRCTGRTTGIALEALSKAILAQGVPITVRDHYPGPPRNAAEVMYGALRRCEKALELKHIEVTINTRDGTCTVTSHIWE